MDSDKVISGAIKFILAFGLTAFLVVKGYMNSYERIEIDGKKITFYRVHVVDEEPKENFFFKKRLYDPKEVREFVYKINGEMFFLGEGKKLCAEEDAVYVAVKLSHEQKKQ